MDKPGHLANPYLRVRCENARNGVCRALTNRANIDLK